MVRGGRGPGDVDESRGGRSFSRGPQGTGVVAQKKRKAE